MLDAQDHWVHLENNRSFGNVEQHDNALVKLADKSNEPYHLGFKCCRTKVTRWVVVLQMSNRKRSCFGVFD